MTSKGSAERISSDQRTGHGRAGRWLRSCARSLDTFWEGRQGRRARRRYQPEFEILEDRTTPSTFNVINNGDSGAGSLRQAILDANSTNGADIIHFNLASNQLVIRPLSALPQITQAVTLDGTSQSGYAGVPLVEIDGSSAGAASGLEIASGSCTIRGLSIYNFDNFGIFLQTGGSNVIEGNYLGTNSSNTSGLGNGGGNAYDAGVYIYGSNNNTIGGTTASTRNVISGNDGAGIVVFFSTNNVISGNYIGTDSTGTTALGNSSSFGAVILGSGAQNNILGGSTSGSRNVISGNTTGLHIFDSDATGNKVQGNYIGTDATGTAKVANSTGILIDNGAHDNYIGTDGDGVSDATEGNLVSGNGSWGIQIGYNGLSTDNNVLAGNLIGTDITGTARLANALDAITIGYANGNRIGTNSDGVSDALERNIISGNGQYGISLHYSGSGNLFAGNYIGTDITGMSALRNNSGGFWVDNVSNTVIGGTTSAARNVISGHSGSGQGIFVAATNTTIQGNYIGVNAAGTATLGNGTGIMLASATGTVIGGSGFGEGNLIGGNTQAGISLHLNSNNNTIKGNHVGTDGTRNLGNLRGIWITGDNANNTIGGSGSSDGNLVGFSSSVGILLDAGAHDNVIQGNSVGADGSGQNLGNDRGIWLSSNTYNNLVEANLVGFSTGAAVVLDNSANNNIIQGNRVGVTSTQVQVGNGIGMLIFGGAYDNDVLANRFAFNTTGAVTIVGSNSTGNTVRLNIFQDNGGTVIDLGGDGATANDPADSDTGPNLLINSPSILGSYINASGELIVSLLIDIDSNYANFPTTVDLYYSGHSGASDVAEGQVLLGTFDVSVSEGNNGAVTVNLGSSFAVALTTGDYLVGLVTDSSGNTSEFSAASQIGNTIYVTNDSDNGLGSLRQAITDANAMSSANIKFRIRNGGPQTIYNLFPLPKITASIFLDGSTQPGYAGVPLITLDGGSGSYSLDGLVFESDGNHVRALMMMDFVGSAMLFRGHGNVVDFNYIGTDATKTQNRGNGTGIRFESSVRVGVPAPNLVSHNVIAFNGKGVVVPAGSNGDQITANQIFANLGLGIDIGDDGPTANNSGSQNSPVLGALSQTTLRATLQGLPSHQYRLEFFRSTTADPGQGQQLISTQMVMTDATGFATTVVNVTGVPGGTPITATATDTSTGDTSEFSVPGLAGRPSLALGGEPNVPGFQPYILQLLTDNPSLIRSWTIHWGDGTIETVNGSPPTVSHIYTDFPNGYTILASAVDIYGARPAAGFQEVNVLTPNIAVAVSAPVPPGSTPFFLAIPDAIGATVIRIGGSRTLFTLFLALYGTSPVLPGQGTNVVGRVPGHVVIVDPSNPGPRIDAVSYDLRANGASLGDVIIVTFQVPPGSIAPDILYFDESTRTYRHPYGSTRIPNSFIFTGTSYIFIFDSTSFPSTLFGLNGTVFTISATPPAPPVPAATTLLTGIGQLPATHTSDPLAGLLGGPSASVPAGRLVGSVAPTATTSFSDPGIGMALDQEMSPEMMEKWLKAASGFSNWFVSYLRQLGVRVRVSLPTPAGPSVAATPNTIIPAGLTTNVPGEKTSPLEFEKVAPNLEAVSDKDLQLEDSGDRFLRAPAKIVASRETNKPGWLLGLALGVSLSLGMIYQEVRGTQKPLRKSQPS